MRERKSAPSPDSGAGRTQRNVLRVARWLGRKTITIKKTEYDCGWVPFRVARMVLETALRDQTKTTYQNHSRTPERGKEAKNTLT